MKTKMTTRTTKEMFKAGLLMTLLIVGIACDNETVKAPSAYSNETITVPFFVTNEEGNMPDADDQLLHEFRLNNPVVDTEGNQLTWAEFSTVKGNINVECQDNGFKINMELTGLIPNGVYTIWNVTFNNGGMNTEAEMLNIRGIGCIGDTDGTENYFTASADGKGSISAFTQTPDDLSMIGDIKACPISDEVEFHVVGAYHMDGKTWGANLGPDGTAIEQFAFIFKEDQQ